MAFWQERWRRLTILFRVSGSAGAHSIFTGCRRDVLGEPQAMGCTTGSTNSNIRHAQQLDRTGYSSGPKHIVHTSVSTLLVNMPMLMSGRERTVDHASRSVKVALRIAQHEHQQVKWSISTDGKQSSIG